MHTPFGHNDSLQYAWKFHVSDHDAGRDRAVDLPWTNGDPNSHHQSIDLRPL